MLSGADAEANRSLIVSCSLNAQPDPAGVIDPVLTPLARLANAGCGDVRQLRLRKEFSAGPFVARLTGKTIESPVGTESAHATKPDLSMQSLIIAKYRAECAAIRNLSSG